MTQYSVVSILRKLISYRFKAKTIHQIHSPFVFHLVKDCLSVPFPEKYMDIQKLKRALRSNQTLLEFTDYGKEGEKVKKTVSKIARTSLKPRKYAELLAQLCGYFKVKNAIELGTSLGISSSYIARNISGKLYTFEGGISVLNLARDNWTKLGIENIESIPGPFSDSLDQIDQSLAPFDLIFIDGHHKYQPTLAYFKHLIRVSDDQTVFVFDDIHWSAEMEKAWEEIKEMTEVRCTVDLFFIGLVFLRKELSKKHFVVKY